MPESPRQPMSMSDGMLVRDAIYCLASDPDLHSLLVSGPSGVGKTWMITHEIEKVSGRSPLRIHSSITDEELYGTIDIEWMMSRGETRYIPGILTRSDGGFLFIDDATSLDYDLIREVLEIAEYGRVRVERNGMSFEQDLDLSVVVSFNIDEVEHDRKLLSLFDMRITLSGSLDAGKRARIIESDITGLDDPSNHCIDAPVNGCGSAVTASPEVIGFVESVCVAIGCGGCNTDLATIRVARHLAEMRGRDTVNAESLNEALHICINRESISRKISDDSKEETRNQRDPVRETVRDDMMESDEAKLSDVSEVADGVTFSDKEGSTLALEDVVVSIEEKIEAEDILLGLREYRESELRLRGLDGTGRVVGSRLPESDPPDIDILSTIKAAIPFQKVREIPEGMSFAIREEDYRERRRSNEHACLFLFLIDSSGSLIARNRIKRVKQTIDSLMSEHSRRKDKVAVVTFDRRGIRVLVHPTRSFSRVGPIIDGLSIGSKTPLSEALVFSDNFVRTYSRHHPADLCRIIMFTDGDANMAIDSSRDPLEEAVEIAGDLSTGKGVWMVVDIDPLRGRAKAIADALGADYRVLENLIIR